MTVLDDHPDLDTDDHTDPGTDVDAGFAARAATYLRSQGLDRRAVALALCTELGVPAPDAIRLAANAPNTN